MFVLFFSYAGSAKASTIKAVTLDQMAQSADTLVQGNVVEESQVLRMYQGKLQPYTVYHIRVDHVFKTSGALIREGELIYVDRLGGNYQGLHTTISGSHTYKVGQRLVMFLDHTSHSKHFVAHALKRAIYQIVFDSVQGWVVTQDTRDLIMIDADNKRLEHGHIERMSLTQMQQRIEAALKQTHIPTKSDSLFDTNQHITTPTYQTGVIQ